MLSGRTRLALLRYQLKDFNAFVSSYSHSQYSTLQNTPTSSTPSTSQTVATTTPSTTKSLKDSHSNLNQALSSGSYQNIISTLKLHYFSSTTPSFPPYAVSYTLELILADPIPDQRTLDAVLLLFKYSRRIDAVPYDTSVVELFARVFTHIGEYDRALKIIRSLRRLNRYVGVDVMEFVAQSMEASQHNALALRTLSMMAYDDIPTVGILNIRLRCSIACEEFNALNLVEFEHFNISPNQDTYHALIFGHLLNGNLAQSKFYLAQMHRSGYTDNVATHLAILRAYRTLGIDTTLEHNALNDTARLGLNADARVLNALMMLRIDAEDDRLALRIFEKFFNHSIRPNTDSLEELVKDALESRNIAFKKPLPDAATYAIIIQIYARNNNLARAISYYEDYRRYIVRDNRHVEAALVSAYVSNGETSTALWKLRNGQIRTTTKSINALLKGSLLTMGMDGLYMALRLFRRFRRKPDQKTLELILHHLHDLHMPPSKLIRLLNKFINMSSHRITLNTRLFNIIRLSTSDHVKALVYDPSKGIQRRTPGVGRKSPTYIPSYESISRMQEYLENKGMNDDSMSVAIKMRLLAVAGDFDEAKAMLKEVIGSGYRPNKYHFGALIGGATQNRNFELAQSIISQATRSGVQPNSAMFSTITAGYAKAGMFQEACEMFDWMLTKKMKVGVRTTQVLIKTHLDARMPAKALKFSKWLGEDTTRLDDGTLATLYRLYDYHGMYREADEAVKHVTHPTKQLRDAVRLMKKRRMKLKVYQEYNRSFWSKLNSQPEMLHYKITQATAALFLAVAASAQSESAQSAQVPVVDLSAPYSTNEIPGNRSFDAPFFVEDDTFPRIQIFDEKFKQIVGDEPTIHSIAKSANDSFNAFHEAPLVRGDLVYFSSNAGSGGSGPDRNNRLLHVNLTEIEELHGDGNITVTYNEPSDRIQMINGMAPYLNNSMIIATEGRENAGVEPGLFRYQPETNTTTPLLTSFYGRRFDSLNDLKIHSSNQVIFVDSLYGFLQDFAPFPELPEMVYAFDMDTGKVRPVATDFVHPNGIALSPDESVAYVTDTGAQNGTVNTHLPASIYAYDIKNDDGFLTFNNRRIFAHALTGVPDGIHCDDEGNVWSGVGDGVAVWDKRGELLGLINIGTTSANFVLVGDGLIIVLAETEMFAVRLDSSLNPAKLHYAE
ncbi:hypothetical protein E3P81_03429 [Wallemia ichthyophaga]|nr:hypothetical protein E3P97_03466 [Wallemia ichthyophaga]TIB00857.1 hypothetical protein E3P96_02540 [Wallemia ichthyophaga]TIB28911.1 hypothetical protein E3P85_03423 [Wallemia ichthyophaga]TIB44565.1 hypothetical protein E3P82_03434 [Wallemia ichthyophaga]TIB47014.1 hypothetical protein E3P81_03429 [Wallemia ichthyophaga]